VHAAQLVLSSLESNGDDEGLRRPALDFALAELDAAAQEIEASVTELRTTLGGRRLETAIATRVGELQAASGIPMSLSGRAGAVPAHVAVHAYRVACEAISNAVRHAHASRVEVDLQAGSGRLRLSVADDGRGLPAVAGRRSSGLASMQARARTLNGELRLERGLAGRGTAVVLEIPLRERPR